MQKVFLPLFILLMSIHCLAAEEIWSVGKCDGSYAEFFAAKDYRKVAERFPGEISVDLRAETFDPSVDFPWILPGPTDPWADARARTIRVTFHLPAEDVTRAERYVLEIVGIAQNSSPPLLEASLNGTAVTRQTVSGITGDGILSHMDGAVWMPYRFVFPAAALKAGDNQLTIRAVKGSWLVFDSLRFSALTGKVTDINVIPLPGFSRGEDGVIRRYVEVDFGGEVLTEGGVILIFIPEDDSTWGTVGRCVLLEGANVESAKVSVLLADESMLGQELKLTAKLWRKPSGVLTAGTVLPPVPKPWIDEVILVFKTHFDIGYTHLASEVVENYRTRMIDHALDVVDASKDMPEEQKFVWTLPGWPMATILKDQTPERAARLDHAVGTGRFAVHALPFTMHMDTVTEEDHVRGLRFSTNVAKKYGLPLPTDAKMTDVECHSWFLPTFLAHAGITFMHEGTNDGSRDPEVPILHFREGPDGSRVLTMHVAGYGSGLEPPPGWPYRTWLWLVHTGDNDGPPSPQQVAERLHSAVSRFPHAKIRIGRLSDFGDAILAKEDLAQIPVVTEDMPDTWLHGPMCDPRGQSTAKAVHEALTFLEMYDSLYGKSHDLTQKIADARELSLLYGEHTWGAALYWVCNYGAGHNLPYGDDWKALINAGELPPNYRRVAASWEEKSDYIRQAAKTCMPEEASISEKKILFNPLPWDLTDYRGRTLAPGAVARNELAAGNEAKRSDRIEPSSDSSLQSGHSANATFPAVISTSHFALTVDPKTGEISLDDLKNNRAVFRNSSPGFLYQRADAELCDTFMRDFCVIYPDWILSEITKRGLPRDVPEQRFFARKVKNVETEENAAVGEKTVRITYDPGEEFPFDALSVEITLYEHRPEVRFTFDGKAKKPDTWPEAGYFHFPLAIESPQFRLGRLGGITNPVTDLVRGSNRHLLWLRTGVAVYGEDGFGVGICPLDAPLVSLDEPGCWRYSMDYTPKKADIWFNLFNNQYTTNFRLWNEGDIRASFILWTFDDYDGERSLITPSLEAFALNFQPEYPAADTQTTQGIRLDRKGIYISSFGVDPDTGRWMLRMWEMAGRGAETPAVTVRLPEGFSAKSVQPCDLRGRPVGEAIPVTDGAFRVEVKPYAPVNLQIEF